MRWEQPGSMLGPLGPWRVWTLGSQTSNWFSINLLSHETPGENKCLRRDFTAGLGKPLKEQRRCSRRMYFLNPALSVVQVLNALPSSVQDWALFFPGETQQRSILPYKEFTAVVTRLMYHTYPMLDNSAATRHHHHLWAHQNFYQPSKLVASYFFLHLGS